MVFVAERLRRKFVALVNAGSNPVKHPKKSFQKIWNCEKKYISLHKINTIGSAIVSDFGRCVALDILNPRALISGSSSVG